MKGMARNQGFNRLTKGYLKTLNISEVSRGWLYLTRDTRVLEALRPPVTVMYKNKKYSFDLDRFGRILTGVQFVNSLPKTFYIKLSNGIIEIYDETNFTN